MSATTLDNAVVSHARWKAKFREAIAQRLAVDTQTVCVDDSCDLGRWLYGEGHLRHGGLPEFVRLIADHKAFHLEACKVARTINNQDYSQADGLLENGTAFGHASSAVILSITALKRVTN